MSDEPTARDVLKAVLEAAFDSGPVKRDAHEVMDAIDALIKERLREHRTAGQSTRTCDGE